MTDQRQHLQQQQPQQQPHAQQQPQQFQGAPMPLGPQQHDQGELVMQEDIDRILARLDAEIPEAQKRMDELLARLRTTRIMVAA